MLEDSDDHTISDRGLGVLVQLDVGLKIWQCILPIVARCKTLGSLKMPDKCCSCLAMLYRNLRIFSRIVLTRSS